MNYNDRPIKIFFSYYKPHLKLFAGDMICALLISVVDVAFPMVSRFAVNSLIPGRNIRAFLVMILILLGVYIIRRICTWFVNYWGHVFGTLVEADMRRDVFRHLERQSFSFYDSHRTGKIMSRVTTDLFEITELAHHGPEDFFISILTLFGSFFMLLRIRREFALVVFLFVPMIVTVAMFSRKKLSSSSKKVKETTAGINASLESSISGIRVTKGFSNEAYEENRFERDNAEFRAAKKNFYKSMSTFHSNVEFFNNILNVVVLAVGGIFIMDGKLTVADLVAANLFVSAFTMPIKRLSNFVEQYTTGMAGFSRFLELMRTDSSEKDAPDAVEILAARGNIDFRDVSFCYRKDFPVLEGVSLHVGAGEKFAFVGTSGGGKTSLCSLIPRFYEISGGEILLDGMDIRKIKLSSLRSQIGIVQQDVFLFAGTVRENIAYGKIGATDEEIERAARRAEIHDDIMLMPDGYDTVVGERGIKLSGGQKQRISIARCFLKNPPVLILDEATSALDTATEIKIQGAFDSLSEGRTTLVIAHRLSTIRNADRIAVVDGHGIAESGTHSELMEKKGIYYGLYEAQRRISGQD